MRAPSTAESFSRFSCRFTCVGHSIPQTARRGVVGGILRRVLSGASRAAAAEGGPPQAGRDGNRSPRNTASCPRVRHALSLPIRLLPQRRAWRARAYFALKVVPGATYLVALVVPKPAQHHSVPASIWHNIPGLVIHAVRHKCSSWKVLPHIP